MNLLIFFAVVFATIIFSIILERLINSPILVGFAFFSIFLIVTAVLNNIALIIVSIGLGILAFIVAFLDCFFRKTDFFRNNNCLIENSNIELDDENTLNTTSSNCGCSGRNSRYRRY